MQLKTIIKTSRPSFLVLAPICVLLGLATSVTAASPINYFSFFLIIVAAISAHISVNTLNEFYDFKNGLDFKTIKTPFSGGSGALPDNPHMAQKVFSVGLISLMLTVFIGIFFIVKSGSQILPIGLVGIILIASYTQWLNRVPILCLVAPGLGFGILMVVGTHILLTGQHSPLVWLISLIPFFLINNLLLLNQYPDVDADASVGRNTFPIAFGIKMSNVIYAVFMLAAYLLILLYIVKAYLPVVSAIALIPMGLSLYSLTGAIKYASKIGEHPHFMAANVIAVLLTPLLLAISIFVA